MSIQILLTGAAGCLGRHLCRLAPAGITICAVYRQSPVNHQPAIQLDLSDSDSVMAAFRQCRPDIVIHTAYSNTDPERDIVRASANVAHAAACVGARLIHCSTDCVLDGDHAPYDESAAPEPVFPYGRAKAEAEELVQKECPGAVIARIALVVGLDPMSSSTKWVVDALSAGETISLFTDELRTPILATDLAQALWEIARLDDDDAAGIWNLAGPDVMSRHELGDCLARYYRLDSSGILPVLSEPSNAPRPRDLRLSTARLHSALASRPQSVRDKLCGD